MTSRERLTKVLNRELPDHVPAPTEAVKLYLDLSSELAWR
jgi:hypothetical protein